ncbi:hypothetical protein SS1G_08649 [Sclerotinia sclerotiorum 1980 UF-70]|uniref:Nephrocystin 3-like N-terminal domain-containing protein n=1 Tax=Sclerotinia sclerotiorum (strain ATCC 18683 / 1980 / Ss-1) TaxID=665079 RepID=A7ETJ3_SCLS1|nr:hypothetical protein SS1G_08649 [Sclerotinia sclerotiorum 1980 UF-70]EDN92785.1 hypothetical protein SS1G_08649 [Sclerotinia sclerotiorum 1980 UF-70]
MVENIILDLWVDAQKRLFTITAYQKYGGAFNEAVLDPSKWSEILERSLEESEGPLKEICRKVGRHIEAIQSAINIANEVFQIVAVLMRLLEKGIKLAFKEDTELSKLLSEMQFAKNQVDRCIDTANYREIKRAGASIEAIDKSFSREERNEILEWLSSLDFETRHGELLGRVKGRPNARKKLLDSKAFQNWTETPSSKLWYTGKPEAGKSVLASIIILHLQNVATKDKSEPVVAFLYMSHKRETTVRDLLGSVVRHIVAEMPLILFIIEDAWNVQTSRSKYDGKYPKTPRGNIDKFLVPFAFK